MFLKQEDFNFLNLFLQNSTTKTVYSDKIGIISDKDSKDIYVVMYGEITSFIKVLKDKNDKQEQFSFIYPVSQLSNLISLFKKGDIIEFTDNELKIGKSVYKFESIDMSIFDIVQIKSAISNIETKNSLKIKDLNLFSFVKSYMGTDDLSVVCIFSKYFVTSNKSSITSSILTSNDLDKKYIHSSVMNIAAYFKLTEIELFTINMNEQKQHVFITDNTYIYLPYIETCILPNIFSIETKAIYEHDTICTVDKDIFTNALRKINVVSKFNYDSRIHVSFKDNKMVIESISPNSSDYGKEEIDVKYDSEIEGVKVILSSTYLLNICNTIESKSIILKINPDMENAVAISIQDEAKKAIFIHNIYEDLN